MSSNTTGNKSQVIVEDQPAIITRLQVLTAAEQRLNTVLLDRREETMGSSVKNDSAVVTKATKKVGLLKSFERNILAFFKMGRIESIAKNAAGKSSWQ